LHFPIDHFQLICHYLVVMKKLTQTQTEITLKWNHYGASFALQVEGTIDRVNRFINACFNYGGLSLDAWGCEKIERVEVGGNSFANFQISKENLYKVLYNMKLVSLVYKHGKGGRVAKKLAAFWADARIANMQYDSSIQIV
jgi:hypothetical protein